MKHKFASRKFWTWLIGQIIVLVVGFGIDISPELRAILLTTGSAFLAGAYQLVEGFVDRSKNAKVNDEQILELTRTILALKSAIEGFKK